VLLIAAGCGHIRISWRVEEVVASLEQGITMTALTSSGVESSCRAMRLKSVTYWVATGFVVVELVLGGIWDVLRISLVRDVVTQVGYPTYFLGMRVSCPERRARSQWW
jgi:hypothetical protein